jgi:phosphoglycerate kinase
MDQNRLEELKKLLQKRHQEPKRGLEQNSNGENSGTSNFGVSNFKAQNSEISNSEASNFEASNFRTLNFEASNFEILNSEPPNFESLNSKAPNSATDALNLEAKAAQNSACENSAEQQNFISDDSGSLRQNSKARDYDKNPLIIKDHTYYDYMKYSIVPTMVGLLIALAFATIVNPINIEMFRLVPLVLVIFVTNFMNRDGAYFVFYNDKILYYNKNKIRKTFELNKIGAMVLSFDWRWSWKQKIPIFIKIFLVIWFLLGWLATGEPINGVAIIFTFCFSILTTKAYMHLLNGSLSFFGLHDQLVLYKENAEVEILNILMANKEEYLQLRDYFMQTMQKDISNLARTMSIFNKKIEFRKFKF